MNKKVVKKVEKKPEKEMAFVKITMPPHFTEAQVKKSIREWKSIINTFAKLTGEDKMGIKMYKIEEDGKKTEI